MDDDPLRSVAVQQHLADTVRVWLGLPRAAGAEPPSLPDDLARLVLRTEEYRQRHRDQWGCWEFAFSDNFRRGRLWEPEVDVWLTAERRALSRSVTLEPLWPDGHRFAVCLTHDVDLISPTSTPAQALRSARIGFAPSSAASRGDLVRVVRPGVRAARALYRGISTTPVAAALERSVGIELEHGVRGSYFFTTYPGSASSRYDCVYAPHDACLFRGRKQSVRDLMRRLASEGFDVGLHGSFHSALSSELLSRERAALANATGLELTTTRQHFLHWDVRTTPYAQEAAGFALDATVGFNRNIGFRAGTALPLHHFDLERDERLNLLILPLIVHDGPLLRADALELNVELARESVRQLMDAVADTGGAATFLFHPNNLEQDEHERLYRWTIAYGLERGAWFASARDIDAWWRSREARLLAG